MGLKEKKKILVFLLLENDLLKQKNLMILSKKQTKKEMKKNLKEKNN